MGPVSAGMGAIRPGGGMPTISVAIPTFGREEVLVDTIASILADAELPLEILVVDQTPDHEAETERRLSAWDRSGAIRWIRLERPSITAAMNRALVEARGDVVLFLDDDIIPVEGLVAGHALVQRDLGIGLVMGQVLQPGEEPSPAPQELPDAGLRRDLGFRFNDTQRRTIANCMACNLSVGRREALAAGGFDENFVAVAFRFETEFCRRLAARGVSTVFDPRPSIRHLKAARGGTRSFGGHLRSAGPEHGVGDYYFALRGGTRWEALRYTLRRLVREVSTRFHATHPWWIPVKLLGEARALAWALRLARQGPRTLDARDTGPGGAPASDRTIR